MTAFFQHRIISSPVEPQASATSAVDLMQAAASKDFKETFADKSPTSYQNHIFWLTKKALGLSPKDTFPYDPAELEYVREMHRSMWFDEACALVRVDDMPGEYAQAAIHEIKKMAEKLDSDGLDFFIKNTRKVIDSAPLPVDADFSEVSEYANNRADYCARLFEQYKQKILDGSREQAEVIAQIAHGYITERTDYVLKPDTSSEGMFLRAVQTKFWSRYAKKRMTRAAIQLARNLQMTGIGRTQYNPKKIRSEYLPYDVVRRAHTQIKITEDWLATTVMVSECGEVRTLAEIVGNAKENQMHLLSLRTIAQMEIAEKRGLEAYLLTITLPSRFHPTRTVGKGKKKWSVPNPNYQNLTASDGCAWKKKHFDKFRARLQKMGIDYEYMGALEGTKDGTPHWHFLIYFAPGDFPKVHKLLDDEFLFERDNYVVLQAGEIETGAKKHRLDLKKIRSKDGARSYITKIMNYVLKNSGETNKPTGEALYAKSLGQRFFSIRQQNIQIWNWLRTVKHPDSLPGFLRADWHYANGRNPKDDALPFLPKTILGRPNLSAGCKIENRSCKVEHMVGFLTGAARQCRPVYALDDFFDIEHKTLADFADQETGEIGFEAWEDYQTAWLAWHDSSIALEDQPLIKSITRKLNAFGESKKPSGKFPSIALFDDDGNCIGIAHNHYKKIWTRDDYASAKLKREKEKAITVKKTTELLMKIVEDKKKTEKLQLSTPSQGGVPPLSKLRHGIDLNEYSDQKIASILWPGGPDPSNNPDHWEYLRSTLPGLCRKHRLGELDCIVS